MEHYSVKFGKGLTMSKAAVSGCHHGWRVVTVHLDVVQKTRWGLSIHWIRGEGVLTLVILCIRMQRVWSLQTTSGDLSRVWWMSHSGWISAFTYSSWWRSTALDYVCTEYGTCMYRIRVMFSLVWTSRLSIRTIRTLKSAGWLTVTFVTEDFQKVTFNVRTSFWDVSRPFEPVFLSVYHSFTVTNTACCSEGLDIMGNTSPNQIFKILPYVSMFLDRCQLKLFAAHFRTDKELHVKLAQRY